MPELSKTGVKKGLSRTRCARWTTHYGIRTTEYGIRTTEYGIRTTEYVLRITYCVLRFVGEEDVVLAGRLSRAAPAASGRGGRYRD